jgi:hypothetical protein
MSSSHAKDWERADVSFQRPCRWLPESWMGTPLSRYISNAPSSYCATGDNARIGKQVALSSLFHTKVCLYEYRTRSGDP